MIELPLTAIVKQSKKTAIVDFFIRYLEALKRNSEAYKYLTRENVLFILNTGNIRIRIEEVVLNDKHTAIVRATYENDGKLVMHLSLENDKWRITRTRITSCGKAVPAADTVRGSL